MMANQTMGRQIRGHANKIMLAAVGAFTLVCGSAHAVTSVTDTQCDSRLDITLAANVRSSVSSASTCQTRSLTSLAGFALTASNPANLTVNDSSALQSAGGELYESFVSGIRQAIVLLSPNHTLMMSRNLVEVTGVDWDMGLAVQPVTNGNNAYLSGTYVFLRANRDDRIVDNLHQTNAGLSQVFDPVSMRVTFNGDSTCSVSGYSSWFAYELTTDPGLFYNQPDGANYGLHQAVYAGASSGQQHRDSALSFSTCTYTLATDGKLAINYVGTKGDASAFNVNNAYFVSTDLRYIVPTVDATKDLYRGFELGVRVSSLSGTQSALNNSIAGTYLLNGASVELQGATGPLSLPDNAHRNDNKSTQCLNRSALVLTTTAAAQAGWNTCTIDLEQSCAVRGEEGYGESSPGAANGNTTINHVVNDKGATPSCRFQLASDSTLSLIINQETAEGMQDVTYNGAIASGNEALVLRGKYEGGNMLNPSNTYLPARTIKNDLLVSSLLGIKYAGTLSADADGDGITNEMEFLGSGQAAADTDGDGFTDAQESALGFNSLNNLDPPVPATSSTYILGFDGRNFGTAQSQSAYGTAWSGSDGSLVTTGTVTSVSDNIMSSATDFCVVGTSGVGCLWWAMDATNVSSGELLPAQVGGQTVYPEREVTHYLRYQDGYGDWHNLATDAFRISGDHHSHACVVSKTLGVYCWGAHSASDTVAANIPAGLKNVSTVQDIAVGSNHACAINNAAVQCWGDSSSGKTSVPGAVNAPKQIVAGANHTCVINGNNTVSCWGDNTYGQTTVPGSVTSPLKIAAGATHTCVVNGSYAIGGTQVICWGNNASGQTTVPVSLTNGATTPVNLRSADNSTCAVLAGQHTSNGAMQCWPVDHAP